MVYRAEIDGLRALAVMPVILYHSGFPGFGGGFVGVDVFFVISGYLITGILCDDLAGNRFSILRFYERRVRRILPALFLVCIVCLPFAWSFQLPSEFVSFSASLVAIVFFVSNYLFAADSGYFQAPLETMPLVHTWSLAVEEQFYILYPAILYLLGRWLLRFRTHVVLGIVLLSFVWMISIGSHAPEMNFYGLPSRSWELGVGALLSLMSPLTWPRSRALGAGLALAGLVFILIAVSIIDPAQRYPSAITLLPVGGAAFVIAFANPDNLAGRMLSVKPLVTLGLISYSAYLWHQPVLVFGRITLFIDQYDPLRLAVLVTFTLALAFLTWKFVEQPFRNRNSIGRRNLFASAAITSIALLGAGLSFPAAAKFPGRISPEAVAMSEWATGNDMPVEGLKVSKARCLGSKQRPVMPEEACEYGSGNGAVFAIVGDSHANALAPQLAARLDSHGVRLREFTHIGCRPGIGKGSPGGSCRKQNRRVLDYLLKQPDVDTVVILARWPGLLESAGFFIPSPGILSFSPNSEFFRRFVSGAASNSGLKAEKRAGKGVHRYIDRLLRAGKKIVLVYTVPEVGRSPAILLAREIVMGVKRKEPLSTPYDLFRQRNAIPYALLDRLGNHANLSRVYPEQILCNTFVANGCANQVEGKPIYRDDDHLNSLGNSLIAKEVVSAMESKNLLVAAP